MEYKQLAKSERYYIAREMGRSHTTVSRELRRNLDIDFGFYSGIRAETLVIERKKVVNFKTRKKPNISSEVSSFVFNSLQVRTSPEQICGRLKVKFGLKFSHPTLYKHINEDKRNGGTL